MGVRLSGGRRSFGFSSLGGGIGCESIESFTICKFGFFFRRDVEMFGDKLRRIGIRMNRKGIYTSVLQPRNPVYLCRLYHEITKV